MEELDLRTRGGKRRFRMIYWPDLVYRKNEEETCLTFWAPARRGPSGAERPSPHNSVVCYAKVCSLILIIMSSLPLLSFFRPSFRPYLSSSLRAVTGHVSGLTARVARTIHLIRVELFSEKA